MHHPPSHDTPTFWLHHSCQQLVLPGPCEPHGPYTVRIAVHIFEMPNLCFNTRDHLIHHFSRLLTIKSQIWSNVCHACYITSYKLFGKRGYFSNPPPTKKNYVTIFLGGSEDFILVQLILFMQRIIKLPLSGHLKATPFQNALQCTTVQCNVL